MSMAASAHASLWVSEGGDDANPGTEERPLRTLERARDVVRTLNRDMSDDITVFVGGEFHVGRPIEFGAGDSGSNGFNIIYTAAPGEHPVLSGGVRVGGWALADKDRNLWSAPVPAGLENTYNLFVNGTPAGRTRSRLMAVFTKDSVAAPATSPDPTAQWKNPDDVAFEPSGGEAIWSERTGTLPVFVENAFELLGTPGEWYLDRPARRIYYTPRTGEDMASADVEAAVARALIIGLGTLDRPITGIIFKGFRFEYTTWHHTPDDAPPAGGVPSGPTWGAVNFNYAAGIQILEDEFLHMGTPALELGPRVDASAVEGCLFGDIAWPAIRLTEASAIRIAQSRLSYVATGHFPRGAIEVSRSRDVVVEHDQIDHFPAAAILVTSSRADAVREDSNRISPPMIAFHGAAPGAGADPSADSGISQDYQALTNERFSSPTVPGPPAAVSAEAGIQRVLLVRREGRRLRAGVRGEGVRRRGGPRERPGGELHRVRRQRAGREPALPSHRRRETPAQAEAEAARAPRLTVGRGWQGRGNDPDRSAGRQWREPRNLLFGRGRPGGARRLRGAGRHPCRRIESRVEAPAGVPAGAGRLRLCRRVERRGPGKAGGRQARSVGRRLGGAPRAGLSPDPL